MSGSCCWALFASFGFLLNEYMRVTSEASLVRTLMSLILWNGRVSSTDFKRKHVKMSRTFYFSLLSQKLVEWFPLHLAHFTTNLGLFQVFSPTRRFICFKNNYCKFCDLLPTIISRLNFQTTYLHRKLLNRRLLWIFTILTYYFINFCFISEDTIFLFFISWFTFCFCFNFLNLDYLLQNNQWNNNNFWQYFK